MIKGSNRKTEEAKQTSQDAKELRRDRQLGIEKEREGTATL